MLLARRAAAACIASSRSLSARQLLRPASSRSSHPCARRAASLGVVVGVGGVGVPRAAASFAKATTATTATSLRATMASSAPPPPPPTQPGDRVRIALCQLEVGADKPLNVERARQGVRAAAAGGAKIVVLPEMWNCPYSNASFGPYSERVPPVGTAAKDVDAEESPSVAMMAREAAELGVVVVGGSVPERCPSDGQGGESAAAAAAAAADETTTTTTTAAPPKDRLYNTCCVFERDGTLVAKHRKLHLFDIDIPGKVTFRESETLTRGERPTLVDLACGARLGVGICYDLRFPELALLYARAGATLLVYPGAFNTVTGPLHWELLARARAVDAQCFVAVCSPSRVEGASYEAWGRSAVVGPFAEVLATAEGPGDAPCTVVADLDLKEVAERRRNLPLWAQRRGDLYELVEK